MKFRPLHDRVLVRRLEGEEKTAGGIIIPDTAKEKPQEGEVVAVGRAHVRRTARCIPSTSRLASGSCSANGPAPRSRSRGRLSDPEGVRHDGRH